MKNLSTKSTKESGKLMNINLGASSHIEPDYDLADFSWLESLQEEGLITIPEGMDNRTKYFLMISLMEMSEKMSRWHQEERTDNKRTFIKPTLKDRESGDYKLVNYHIDEHDPYALYHGIDTGDHVKLTYCGEVVMSDTKMERLTNQEFLNNAHGKVLIGGLGLGMILLPLLNDDEVTEITVVEYSQDVINMVLPQLPKCDKLRVVQGDVFTYVPEHKYNTIYMDIWNSINSTVYEEEMCPLMDRYSKYLDNEDDQCFLECWASYEAENDLEL